jgi:ribosomal protein S18 acetylase RimI-like enzyme
MMTADPPTPVVVRPFTPEDAPLRARPARRLHPGRTVSPRDPAALAEFLDRFGQGEATMAEGTESFVADLDGRPVGLLVLHPENDPFTGPPRAYVDVLAVAEDAEGRGAAGALMRFAEAWASKHGCHEVCLDVFAGNERAIAFYEKAGYRPDHARKAKPVDPS